MRLLLEAETMPTFFVGASEKPGVVHEVSLLLVRLLFSKPHPEEVLRFLSLVQNLGIFYDDPNVPQKAALLPEG